MKLHGPDEPVYTISVAARLLGVKAQMLRILEREGLLQPARTEANIRLYSENDLLRLKRICFLVREEGVNLAGVKMILDMESRDGNVSIRYSRMQSRTARDASRDPETGED
ncbi:MAG: MerR family transcriptional regulator [Firmicutes bacterium]|nr:MerR family transcriptional regulator [Bacillota bacterium]